MPDNIQAFFSISKCFLSNVHSNNKPIGEQLGIQHLAKELRLTNDLLYLVSYSHPELTVSEVEALFTD